MHGKTSEKIENGFAGVIWCTCNVLEYIWMTWIRAAMEQQPCSSLMIFIRVSALVSKEGTFWSANILNKAFLESTIRLTKILKIAKKLTHLKRRTDQIYWQLAENEASRSQSWRERRVLHVYRQQEPFWTTKTPFKSYKHVLLSRDHPQTNDSNQRLNGPLLAASSIMKMRGHSL